ncbi:MAG TPA: hypothetical protein DEQ47_15580 [Solibacterales bacterium]|nr:hypothetical protein [Bryobacterales bacterium]
MISSKSDEEFEARFQRDVDAMPKAERDRFEALTAEFAATRKKSSEHMRNLLRRLGVSEHTIGENLRRGLLKASRYLRIPDEQFRKMEPYELADVIDLELLRGGEHTREPLADKGPKSDPLATADGRKGALWAYRSAWFPGASTWDAVAGDFDVDVRDMHAWCRKRIKQRKKIEGQIFLRPPN